MITISIWQSPNFIQPDTFTFPDQTMRVGVAYALSEHDPLEELTGGVTFLRLEEGIPAEGEFNFTTEDGKHVIGRFKAEWGDEAVYCG